MKNLKSQVVGYGLLFAGFVIAFCVVSSSEELFRIDSEAKAKSNQELQTSLNQLEQVCDKVTHVTPDDEFFNGRVCGKSKSLRIELEHLRKKVETAENEIEGEFWLSVMVLGFVIGGSLAFAYMAAVWSLQARTYVPVTIKVPKFEPKFA